MIVHSDKSITIETKQEAVEAAHMGLRSLTNIMGNCEEQDELILKLARDHRTLQQGYARLFLKFFKQLAEDSQKMGCDPRNEAAVKLAEKIIQLEEAQYLPTI